MLLYCFSPISDLSENLALDFASFHPLSLVKLLRLQKLGLMTPDVRFMNIVVLSLFSVVVNEC